MLTFIPKNEKMLFEPPFQDLGTMYALYLQLVVKPVVDFIFAIIRPPDIVCRRTYLPGILSFFFFFRRLISEFAQPNSTQIGHMVRSKCNLMKTHVRNLGYPPPVQVGGPKTSFWTMQETLRIFSNTFARLSMSCFVQKIFAIKCRSRQKPNKCKSFLVHIFSWGTTQSST